MTDEKSRVIATDCEVVELSFEELTKFETYPKISMIS